MTNAHVTSLTTDDGGKVTGVRYRQGGEGEDIDFPAAAVVLTTGGSSSLINPFYYRRNDPTVFPSSLSSNRGCAGVPQLLRVGPNNGQLS